MKDFFSSIKYKLLIGVLVVLAGMMAYAGANSRLTAAPQELLGVVLTPLQRLTATISGGLDSIVTKYVEIDEIVAENEALRERNAELEQLLIDYDQLKAENEAFQNLQEIEETNPEYNYLSAFIIGRDSLEQFSGFTMDVGTANGVARGDTVVSDYNYLVGVVVEANLTSSKVLTILSPNFNAAGVVSRTRDNGILTGSTDYAAEGLCTFTGLSRDTLATVGDEVITTGLGGVYPPDIAIGTIQELVPEVSGKTTTAVIAPGVEVSNVKHVFVITNYEAE